MIKSIGHDGKTNVLEVEFRTGRIYQYFLVPQSVYRELIHAKSIGEYFNTEIRGSYNEVLTEN
ncbi:MAG: KTSC domain-containing protein [Thermoanaerobaculia bacterium]